MIELRERHLNEIREHGERDYPFECCGLLIGHFSDRKKTVAETYPISNAREEEAKRNRFLIRPEELLRGEKLARQKGLDVVGFYHSHPDDKARPSQYDLDHAWPTYSYIIASILQGQAVDVQSWELTDDRSSFQPEVISKGE